MLVLLLSHTFTSTFTFLYFYLYLYLYLYFLSYLGVVTPAELGSFLFATTSVMNLANLRWNSMFEQQKFVKQIIRHINDESRSEEKVFEIAISNSFHVNNDIHETGLARGVGLSLGSG